MPNPRKRFGQHFLTDHQVIDHIILAIAPQPNDHLVEIGPGQGALTFPVLKKIKQLEVVELDRDLIPHLKLRTRHTGQLIIHEADALEFDFGELQNDKRLLRVFGNLPYNISTPLLFHLLEYAKQISDMTFMLQKEVAERIVASPSTEHYSRLSIMVQYHCSSQLLFDVPPAAFFPQPQVTSSIIKMIPYQVLPAVARDYKKFADIVRQAFNMRRKTLHNSLKNMVSDAVWEKVQIDPRLRPENLSVKDYVSISNEL